MIVRVAGARHTIWAAGRRRATRSSSTRSGCRAWSSAGATGGSGAHHTQMVASPAVGSMREGHHLQREEPHRIFLSCREDLCHHQMRESNGAHGVRRVAPLRPRTEAGHMCAGASTTASLAPGTSRRACGEGGVNGRRGACVEADLPVRALAVSADQREIGELHLPGLGRPQPIAAPVLGRQVEAPQARD